MSWRRCTSRWGSRQTASSPTRRDARCRSSTRGSRSPSWCEYRIQKSNSEMKNAEWPGSAIPHSAFHIVNCDRLQRQLVHFHQPVEPRDLQHLANVVRRIIEHHVDAEL